MGEDIRSGAGRLGRLGQAALGAAREGMHVFPLQPRSKLPAVRDWERAATRDPEQIAAWFSARPYNVAIACGPSALVVVDLDDGHGESAPEPWTGARHGREVLAQVAAAAGESVPRTRSVSTPTGGLHLYFRARVGVELRNTAGTALGWRVDTRAHGGYVVAAESVRVAGYYRVADRAPIAELPGWIAAALTPPPAPRPGEVAPVVVEISGGRARAYVAAIVEREAAGVAAAGEGTRHRTLLAAARTLGRLVGGDALDEATARGALLAAAEGYVGRGGYTGAQVARDVDDGLAYGMRLPRRIDAGGAR
jgi:hypothetical protein